MKAENSEKLDYYIGVLSGLAWAALIDDKCRPIAEALDVVIAGLKKIREENMGGV